MTISPAELGLPDKYSSWWPGQEDAVFAIAVDEKRFPLLSAPTGSGKTVINIAASMLHGGRVLYVTANKGLEDQALNDFSSIGMVDVRGHNNYSCGIGGSGDPEPKNLVPSNDDRGSTSWSDVCTLPKENCFHLKAVERAIESDLVLTNYAFWLTLERFGKPDALGKFDVIILDEAHAARDWLAKYCIFHLKRDEIHDLLGVELPKQNPPTSRGNHGKESIRSKNKKTLAIDDTNWISWLEKTAAIAREKSESRVGGDKLNKIRGLLKNLESIVASHRGNIKWLVERSRYGITLRPVWAHLYAEDYLFRSASKVVLSSATLFEDDGKYLGIDSDDSTFHEVESSFDPTRRPFIYIPTARIDYKLQYNQLLIVMTRVDTIINGRLDRKGIIHTRSYDWARKIVAASKHKDIMITHGPGGVVDAVLQFKAAQFPVVLVSPAIEEGYDFPDDQCRWQLIWKVPFVDGRDPITAARSKEDNTYRYLIAAQSLTQAYGRIVRNSNDWGETFILDEHWGYFRNSVRFQRWFTKAWRQERSVPAHLTI